jgi:putative spermidine/putrescine transport system substrate-binding protein
VPAAASVARAGLALLLAALLVVAAGCDHDEAAETGSSPRRLLQSLGSGEGRLDLVTWAGYVEDGSSDPAVDWVTPFERRTGCRVNVRVADTPDEVVELMRTGAYDGASATGDVTGRLVASGQLAPINTRLIPSYADVFDALKRLPANSARGRTYGVPQGRAVNVLMWRTDVVRPAPKSWAVVFDVRSPYRGRVTAYDNPIAIADAAVYLKSARPGLGIDDVYELDDRQFRAAVALLRRQREIISNYWWDFVREQAAFVAGDAVLGTTWQLVAELLRADRVPVATTLPKEGATGWSDSWLISSRARHPSCMYRWIDWMLSPRVNAQVAEWFGEAPANRKACRYTADPRHCATYHAADEDYFAKVAFWKTPRADCGDGRGKVCKSYEDWVDAWEKITE